MSQPYDPWASRPTAPQHPPGQASPLPASPPDDINRPTERITPDQLKPPPVPHHAGMSYPPPSPGVYPGTPPAAGPAQAAWAWPGSTAPAAGYPDLAPPQTSSKRRLVLIGALAVVVVAVAAIGVALVGNSDSSSDSSAPTSTTASATKSPDGVYRVVPQRMLPSASDVQKATMWSMETAGAVATTAANDAATVPPNCAVASSTNSVATWGPAIADASQAYQDGPDDSYAHYAFAGLAVFRSPADAAASMKLVADSVKSCTDTYTIPDTGNKILTWRMSNTQVQDSSVRWQITQVDGPAPWVCTKAYAIKGNLAASSAVCGQTANDGSGILVDQVLAKATK